MAIENITGYCSAAEELSGLCEISGSAIAGTNELFSLDIISSASELFLYVLFGVAVVAAVAFLVALMKK